MFLATHGWWPWLLLYAIIIGVIGAGIIYFLRRHRADKASTVSVPTASAEATPPAPAETQAPPPTDPDA